jgi:hypothetical protein
MCLGFEKQCVVKFQLMECVKINFMFSMTLCSIKDYCDKVRMIH